MSSRHPTRRPAGLLAGMLALALLGACSTASRPSTAPLPAAPLQWHAPLPHAGRLDDLAAWWAQFDDPVLEQLIAAAQDASPSVASAATRIGQARAAGVAADAALIPAVQAGSSAGRGRQEPGAPMAATIGASLQASWEIDLFGAGRAAADAAQARLDAARASWHDARVSVAAEVATAYSSLRACEALLEQARVDAASRAETSRLAALGAASGLQSRAGRELARASASQASAEVVRRRAECERAVKGLVALSGLEEAALRTRLAASTARLPRPAQIDVPSVPARAITQRPDLAAAEREVVAASADAAQREAERRPRIALGGSIGRMRVDGAGVRTEGNTWSFGPLSVSVPVFDGGARRADAQAARARHGEAVALYGARLRGAVREVEEALVSLQGTADRETDARMAADAYHAAFAATRARWRIGLASQFELEDARRSDVQAQSALIDLERERVLAWIALYRALGGGWRADAPPTS